MPTATDTAGRTPAATATSIRPRCSRSSGTRSPRCSAPPPPRRSCGARRGAAAAESPELVELVIRRENLEYRYTLPHAWSQRRRSRRAAPVALRALVAEIGRAAGGADGHRRHPPARADPRAARPRAALAAGGGELSAVRPRLECLSTGSAALDRILGGGLPARSVNVIAGEPGAGKTIFALQMLFHQARQGQEVPLPDDAVRTVAEAHQLHAAVLVLRREPDRRRSGWSSPTSAPWSDARASTETLAEITGRVEQRGARGRRHRQLQGAAGFPRRRLGDADLRLRPRGPRVDLGRGEPVRRRVHAPTRSRPSRSSPSPTASSGSSNRRAGAARDPRGRGPQAARGQLRDRRPLLRDRPRRARVLSARARPGGLVAEPEALDERAPTGVAGLDEMLGGGLPRASATVVQGGTGTGKTLLGLQFLLEGARQRRAGHPLRARRDDEPAPSHRPGLRLGSPPVRGARAAHASATSRPSSCRPIASWIEARQEVERLGARRAVLDSLTSMALGVPSERRFKELVYAITKHFRAAGVTLNMNMEIADLLGSAQLSGHGVSFAADNVIQLKYVEVEGSPRARHLRPQGARRAARDRRAPAQTRRGPDRRRRPRSRACAAC